MPSYFITVHYRTTPFEGAPEVENPEFWEETQHRIKIDLDKELGEVNINQEMQDILRHIALENGYTAVALGKNSHTGQPWIESAEGDSFYND